MAIFNLADVKSIDEFVLDTFYRHYDMYKYALTVKDMLHLKAGGMHVVEQPNFMDLNAAEEVLMRDIE